MLQESDVRGALVDGRAVWSWGSDGDLWRWDNMTGLETGPEMQHPGRVFGAALVPGGRLLSWGADHTLRLWDLATSAGLGPPMAHDEPVRGALLVDDGKRAVSWSGSDFDDTESSTRRAKDHSLRLWDLDTKSQIGRGMRHDDSVSGAVLTRDGARLLSWSEDKTARLWDLRTQAQIGAAMTHQEPVVGAIFSRDESQILSWSGSFGGWQGLRDNSVRLWDAATGKQIGRTMLHDRKVNGAMFVGDGKRVLSWSDDATLRLWDIARGEEAVPAMHHDGPVLGAMPIDGGAHILSWSEDGTLRRWDAATGKPIEAVMRQGEKIMGATLFANGTRILAWTGSRGSIDRDGRSLYADGQHSLRIWDAATGREIGPAIPYAKAIDGVVLTKDESRFAAWSEDQTLRLFDVATALPIGPPLRFYEGVDGALFTEDEARLITWSGKVKIKIFDNSWPRGNLLRFACSVLPDHDLTDTSRAFGIVITTPICAPDLAPADPDWRTIVRQ